MARRAVRPSQQRAIYARTNNPGGFKSNTPGGWVDTSGPVWWYGSDQAYLAGSPSGGRAAVTRAVNLISNRLAGGRWLLTSGAAPRWISDPMATRPDDRGLVVWPAAERVPASTFWNAYIRQAITAGMGWLICQTSDATGEPLAGSLHLLPPEMVE